MVRMVRNPKAYDSGQNIPCCRQCPGLSRLGLKVYVGFGIPEVWVQKFGFRLHGSCVRPAKS